MFVKLVVLACTVAVALSAYNGPLAGGLPASLYPAGVSPEACPNFPHCTNPALAANPSAPAAPYSGPYAGQPVGVPTYNQGPVYGGYNNPNSLDSGAYTGDGDYHGEGLAEAGAFGDISHNYNDPAPGETYNPGPAHNPGPAYNAGPTYNPAPAYNPAAYGQAPQLPAGVDAHSCPNYPYCH